MYLKTSEFEFLKKCFLYLNHSDISDEDLCEYYKIMKRLLEEQKRTNEKTAHYIADKRKTNKLYGRSASEIQKHEEATARKEARRKDGTR